MSGKILTLQSDKLAADNIKRGENLLASLINKLISVGRSSEIERIAKDESYREKLYKEYGLK
ncbi:MAG: hypothetical protein IKW90_14775 [Lachnospiraceae bacterium]|nr:hypothetical protein [Lachnospiraceae bacterium]